MIKTSPLVSCDNKHPQHRDPDLEPYLVWARQLPRYLGIKATAGSLTTFNNQCFMFYTQQMSGPGDHGLTLTLAPGDQGHRGDDEGGQHWEHAETCHGVCCQAGLLKYCQQAWLRQSLALLWLRLWLALVSSHWSPLSPSVGGRPGSGSWTLVVTEPEVGGGLPWHYHSPPTRIKNETKKNCLYVNCIHMW